MRPSYFHLFVPVCGGAVRTFQHLNDLMGGYEIMGVNVAYNSTNSSLSAVKHIDRAVSLCKEEIASFGSVPIVYPVPLRACLAF